ncbi:tripartite tricarboxylate transporter TctB family protein [Jannaschia sp. S6380]|uniref:tripartite tricarboxylate transporter TctB family protein n=1 Tax=Jannaschia sp. S6380 TaxID=2926408 RepID=UPI001FF4A03C|nr:tripartite tricarboxylate transporter TctB family protein [Jannaschia sp. S6380]MCK0166724.1 tripartite tricarboxylate transporter TctB family protein [Jannaschia sp. S6380]
MSVRLAGAAILVVAAFYTYFGRGYSAAFGDVLGPSVFPVLVGTVAMILAGSLVIFPSGTVAWPSAGRMGRQLGALVVLFGYAWVLVPLGFPLATFGLIAGLAIVLGGPVWKSILLGAVMSLGLWALFDQVLGLPLAFLGDALTGG